MEERRKHKRLDLEVMVELERLDEESVTTLKYVHVEVTGTSGLGNSDSGKKTGKRKKPADP